ncbi:unnamed protein product [Caretta caretta]
MNGTANVNVTGRSHYASAIPVPRTMSQSKLPPRQSSLGAPPSQRAASPRPGKAPGCIGSPAAKGSKPKSLSKAPVEARPGPETAEASECKRADRVESGLSQSTRTPGSSPRGGPKATPRATGAPKKALVQGTEREKESPKPGEAYSSHGTKKGSGKPSGAAELAKTPHLQGKSPSRFSLCSESGLPGVPEGSSAKRPQSCPVKGQWVSEALWKGSGVPKAARGEDKSPGISLGTSSPMQNKEPAISFSSVPQQSHPATATVAPFHYRLQGDREKSEFSQEERVCEEPTSPADGPELGFPGLDLSILVFPAIRQGYLTEVASA